MRTREKSKLDIVKEIEARRPKKLTKEYCEKYLNAIRNLLSGGSNITEEEAEEYFITPGKLDKSIREFIGKFSTISKIIFKQPSPGNLPGEFKTIKKDEKQKMYPPVL